MSTKVASIYAEMGIDTKKFDDGIKKAKFSLGEFIDDFGTAIASGLAFAGALKTTYEAIKKSIDKTVEYADEVRNLGRVIGATPEEASKLIQAAKSVDISVAQLTTGLKQAISSGIDPTISGLSQLSQKYLSIQSPIARTKYLMDTFGKSGADLGALMELGAQGISEAGQEAEAMGLVLDNNAIDATIQYTDALDKMNDTLDRYNYTIGLAAINTFNWINDLAGKQADLMDLYENNDGLDSGTRSYIALGWAILDATNYMDGMTQAQLDLKAAQDAVKGVMGFATQALRDYNISAQEKLWLDDQIAIATGKMTEQDIALRDTVNGLTAQLADGTITQWEYFAALQAMNAEALAGVSVLSVLSTALNGLPREIRTKILIEYGYGTVGGGNMPLLDGITPPPAGGSGGGGGGGSTGGGTTDWTYGAGNDAVDQAWRDYWNGKGPKPGAMTGASVKAGDLLWTGESGPEPFIPEVDGRILSRSDAMIALSEGQGGKGDIINYNLTMPTTADPVDVGMAFEILKAYGGR